MVGDQLDIDLRFEGDAGETALDAILDTTGVEAGDRHMPGIGQRDLPAVIYPYIAETCTANRQRRKQPALLAFSDIDPDHVAGREPHPRRVARSNSSTAVAMACKDIGADRVGIDVDQRESREIAGALCDRL